MAKIKTTKQVAKEWIEGVDELSQELTEDSKEHRKEANEHKKQANTLNQISDGIKETLNIKAKGGSITYVDGKKYKFNKDGIVKEVRELDKLKNDGKLLKEITFRGKKYRRNSTYKTYNSVKGNELLTDSDFFGYYAKGGYVRGQKFKDKYGTIVLQDYDGDNYWIVRRWSGSRLVGDVMMSERELDKKERIYAKGGKTKSKKNMKKNKLDSHDIASQFMDYKYPNHDWWSGDDYKDELAEGRYLGAVQMVEFLQGKGNDIELTSNLDGLDKDVINEIIEGKRYSTKSPPLKLWGKRYAQGGSIGEVKVEVFGNGMPIKEYQEQSVEELMGDKPISLAETKKLIFELNDEAEDVRDEIEEAKDMEELVDVLWENQLATRENTYNYSWWGGVYEYAYLHNSDDKYDFDRETIMFISKHRGEDVRGGYEKFKAFKLPEHPYEEIPFVSHYQTIYITAPNGKQLYADTEDSEGYSLTIVEDDIGDMEEGDTTNLDELGKLYGFDAWRYYKKGGKIPKRMKVEIVKEYVKNVANKEQSGKRKWISKEMDVEYVDFKLDNDKEVYTIRKEDIDFFKKGALEEDGVELYGDFAKGGTISAEDRIISIAKKSPHSQDTETALYPTEPKNLPKKFYKKLGISVDSDKDFIEIIEIQYDTKQLILQGWSVGNDAPYDEFMAFKLDKLPKDLQKWIEKSLQKDYAKGGDVEFFGQKYKEMGGTIPNGAFEEIKEYGIDNLRDIDDVYIDDLHHHLYNEDYFITGYHPAKEWMKKHDIDAFELIDYVQDWERDNFGETNTDTNAESMVNMYAYIVGQDMINQLDSVDEARENGDTLTEEDKEKIIKEWEGLNTYGSGGFLLGSMLGGYMGYKLGLSQEKRDDIFANERKFAKKVKASATKKDDD